MLFNNNPRCPHLQTSRLNEEGVGFFLAMQKGSSQHPVCAVNQTCPLEAPQGPGCDDVGRSSSASGAGSLAGLGPDSRANSGQDLLGVAVG